MSDITAAPTPVKLGNTEFLFSPLRDRDWTELNNWIRYKFIESNESALDYMPMSKRDEYRKALMKAASEVAWNSEEGSRIISSRAGLMRAGWMMARLNSQISVEEFERKASEEDEAANIRKIDNTFIEVNFPDSYKEESNGQKTKKEDKQEPVKK